MDDLTNEEKQLASKQGWGLFHIYDMTRSRWAMNILPLNFLEQPNVSVNLMRVIKNAKKGDATCIRALQLMAKFNKEQK